MTKLIISILISSLFLVGCENLVNNSNPNVIYTDEISSETKPNKETSKNKSKIGSITNPYAIDRTLKVNLTCQIPKKGKKTQIDIKIQNISGGNGYISGDGWGFYCNMILLSHKGDFPINLQDYLSLVYYDKDNKIVGKSEYSLYDADSDKVEGLVFRKTGIGVIDSGSVYNSNTYDEFKNKEIDKVALKYYYDNKLKKVFFKFSPYRGSILNPFNGNDRMMLNIYQLPDGGDESPMIEIGLSDVTLSKSTYGYVAEFNLKVYNYINGKQPDDYKIINPSDYLSIVYYYGNTKDSIEYRLCNADGDTDLKVKRGDTIKLYSNTTVSVERVDIPTLIAIKYYKAKKYRLMYFDPNNS